MFKPLDGPSFQASVSVTDSTVFRVRVGSTEFKGRQVITILPTDGKIWVYFGDEVNTPTAATVKSDGFPHFKNSLRTYEATDTQQVFIVADTGTVDVRFVERG
jgi:hypothetical protein